MLHPNVNNFKNLAFYIDQQDAVIPASEARPESECRITFSYHNKKPVII